MTWLQSTACCVSALSDTGELLIVLKHVFLTTLSVEQVPQLSLDALSTNSEQIKLSEFLKRNKNLTFLVNTWCSTGSIPNIIWHCSVTSRDLLRKIFIKTQVTAKDTGALIMSQKWTGFTGIQKHWGAFGRYYCNSIMTLSGATLPTLPNIALKDL